MRLNDLSPEAIVAFSFISIIVLIILIFITLKLIKRKKPDKFRDEWRQLQKKLPDQASWGEAIAEADKLLKDALKKQKIKGKTTGEMLVNAEKRFMDKDEVWFGHKLCKKCETDPNLKLKKEDVKRALIGLQRGIKDLGAFDGKKR